jgi:hypothetical protein
MSATPQATAPNPHTNLLNVYIQIANKMGFKKIKLYTTLVTMCEAYDLHQGMPRSVVCIVSVLSLLTARNRQWLFINTVFVMKMYHVPFMLNKIN